MMTLELAVKTAVTLIAYPILGTVGYYLGYHAKLTEFIWARYERFPRLEKFMRCPACSGAQMTALVAIVLGAFEDLPFLFVSGRSPLAWALACLWGCFWVPIGAAKMLRSFSEVVSPFEAAPKDEHAEATE